MRKIDYFIILAMNHQHWRCYPLNLVNAEPQYHIQNCNTCSLKNQKTQAVPSQKDEGALCKMGKCIRIQKSFLVGKPLIRKHCHNQKSQLWSNVLAVVPNINCTGNLYLYSFILYSLLYCRKKLPTNNCFNWNLFGL